LLGRDASVESSSSTLHGGIQSRSAIYQNGEDDHDEDEYSEEPFQPGSIVRVKLTNFVTYTAAEFHPGPSLNMVIGPNGTGKSTLVCAICLGLGWSPSHLGRAKELGEFVKHGCREAEIEIELAAGPNLRRNPIIRRIIKREGNKNFFHIGDRSATQKDVQALARQFSIQIDNLCQFLPQDRVVEFAALSPVDLLRETQRAAAPDQMVRWHEDLKDLRRKQKKLEDDRGNEQGLLSHLEERQKSSREDVDRWNQRQELVLKVSALGKARPVVEFNSSRKSLKDAKSRRKQTKRELELLRAEIAPSLEAMEKKTEYRDQVKQVVDLRKPQVDKAERHADKIVDKLRAEQAIVKECEDKIKAEDEGDKTRRLETKRLEQAIARLKRDMEQRPVDFNASEFNSRLHDIRRQQKEVDQNFENLKRNMAELREQASENKTELDRKMKERAQLDTQTGQQENMLKKASQDAYQAWRWIQANIDKFEDEVCGPALVTCSVTDLRFADALETRLSFGDMTAITCKSNKDAKVIQGHIFGTMRLHNLSIRTAPKPLSFFNPPVEDPRPYGLDGWLVDYIKGPEPVLAMLCDSARIHSTAITLNRITEAQFQEIQKSPISAWVAGGQMYQINRRREYGATSTTVKALQRATKFTNQPVDTEEKRILEGAINRLNTKNREIKDRYAQCKVQSNELQEQRDNLQAELKEVQQEKDRLQRALADFNLLPDRCRAKEEELALHEESMSETANRKEEFAAQSERAAFNVASLALDYSRAVEEMVKLEHSLTDAEIRFIEANSEVEALKEANAQVQARLREKEQLLRNVQAEETRVNNAVTALRARAQKAVDTLSEEEGQIFLPFQNSESIEDLDAEIRTVTARLELMADGNPRAIRDFESREKQIDELKTKLASIDVQLEQIGEQITEIRSQWEPELDQLVAKISDGFARNFEKIGCAGQVSVYKDEDFENWSIQIQVRFREHEELSILTSQRQSGGERAVSTIFYLMALQDLARSPFRVVDEINQGMDPRNERMVHERMVDIACKERTSQYFLITPKLLNDLKFHPKMKIHCIASGEWMPERYEDLDFQKLASLALRAKGMA
jgi:chromosome segregation ATPase